jgi:Ca2+-binding RTX toxin-like protein
MGVIVTLVEDNTGPFGPEIPFSAVTVEWPTAASPSSWFDNDVLGISTTAGSWFITHAGGAAQDASRLVLRASYYDVIEGYHLIIEFSGEGVTGHDFLDGFNQAELMALDPVINGVPTGGGSDTPSAGSDNISGTSAADLINALGGHDTVKAGAGDDTVNGGHGHDRLEGQLGADKLVGYLGNDLLLGGNGNDTMLGGNGADTIKGGNHADLVNGGLHNDKLFGGNGHDKLSGHTGHDKLYGGLGHDTLKGGNGNDFLRGDRGNDLVKAGYGDDTILDGFGNDTMYGGGGADTFIFDDRFTPTGTDVIMDFDATEDEIVARGSYPPGISGQSGMAVRQFLLDNGMNITETAMQVVIENPGDGSHITINVVANTSVEDFWNAYSIA